jgi:hypothetical protein
MKCVGVGMMAMAIGQWAMACNHAMGDGWQCQMPNPMHNEVGRRIPCGYWVLGTRGYRQSVCVSAIGYWPGYVLCLASGHAIYAIFAVYNNVPCPMAKTPTEGTSTR